jgi:hypothetical protein
LTKGVLTKLIIFTKKELSWTKMTVIVDVVVVNSVMWAEGVGRGVKGVRVKGWGSCYQAGDQSGWEFATMSKKLALQVSRGSLFFL